MSVPKRRAFTFFLGLAVMFALLLPSLRPRPAPRYIVTDLGVLPGDTVSSASGINNHGDVVGFSENSNNDERVFLYAQGRMTVVEPAEAFHGKPTINDSRQINYHQRLSSYTTLSAFEKHYAILYSGSRKIKVPMPPGWKTATLLGMNEQGQVVGSCYRQTIGNPRRAAFVYDSKTSKFSMLPTPPGFQGGFPEDINNHGQIAGIAWNPGDDSQAILWNAGQPGLLAGLPGRSDNQGLGINNLGEVVGTAGAEPNAAARYVSDHPLRWRLLVPFFRKQWENHAVLYKGGQPQDLNALISKDADWTLTEANSINDRGQIVGFGLHHGQQRAFLLTPLR